MKTTIIFTLIFVLAMGLANAATLTCEQTTSSSLEVAQFSSTSVQIQCTASGGTVSNIQITPNPNPGTGLSISTTSSMSSSLGDTESDTVEWSVTGDTPNTYAVAYSLVSDGTEAWIGADSTTIEVVAVAQLQVEYVSPPSQYSDGETLNVKITNIGGTTANSVKLKLNSGSKLNYPSTISANSQASYSWTSSTGFDEADNYTTTVYIGDVQHDTVATEVKSDGSSSTTTTSIAATTTSTASSGGGGGAGAAPAAYGTYSMALKQEMFALKIQDRVSFTAGNSPHTARVLGITSEEVTVEITSDPIEVTVQKGSSVKIDLDSDDIYDLQLRCDRIANASGVLTADLDFKMIEETIPEGTVVEDGVSQPVVDSTEETEETEEDETGGRRKVTSGGDGEEKPNWIIPIILIIVGVLIVAAIVVKIAIQHKKEQ